MGKIAEAIAELAHAIPALLAPASVWRYVIMAFMLAWSLSLLEYMLT